jgi:hypothetical protein
MVNEIVLQGRSKRRGEEVHTALRANPSPLRIALGERIDTFGTFDFKNVLPVVEPLIAARTKQDNSFTILPR